MTLTIFYHFPYAGGDGYLKGAPHPSGWDMKFREGVVADYPRFVAGSLGMDATAGFQGFVSGLSGQSLVVEASTDFTSWTPVATNLMTNSVMGFSGPPGNSSRRFYRTRYLP